MKNIISFLFLAIFVFSFTYISYAQNNSSNASRYTVIAKEAASKLQEKILLSNDQTSTVQKFITKFLSGKKSVTGSEELFSKIEPLLDSHQKAKFEIVKTDWINWIIKTVNNQDQKE